MIRDWCRFKNYLSDLHNLFVIFCWKRGGWTMIRDWCCFKNFLRKSQLQQGESKRLNSDKRFMNLQEFPQKVELQQGQENILFSLCWWLDVEFVGASGKTHTDLWIKLQKVSTPASESNLTYINIRAKQSFQQWHHSASVLNIDPVMFFPLKTLEGFFFFFVNKISIKILYASHSIFSLINIYGVFLFSSYVTPYTCIRFSVSSLTWLAGDRRWYIVNRLVNPFETLLIRLGDQYVSKESADTDLFGRFLNEIEG